MSTKLIKFKKELPEMKIIEKFSPDITTFDTKEDFIEYFNEHKDELNTLTTQKLNKMFKISGYTITKIKGEVSLKSARDAQPLHKDEQSRIETLEREVQTLKNALTNLIDTLINDGIIKNL